MNARPRLIYDGICNLCTSAVRFLSAIDRGRRLQYVPSQQLSREFRDRYRLSDSLLQGQMHFIRSDSFLVGGSSGLAEICKLLTPFGSVCDLLRTAPIQHFYMWIASRRYMLFGCRDTCYLVPVGRK